MEKAGEQTSLQAQIEQDKKLQENNDTSRAVEDDGVVPESKIMHSNVGMGKQKAVTSNLPNVEQQMGSYYLPATQPDAAQTWQALVDALKLCQNTDINVEQEMEASAIKYHQDSFMLARARVVNIQGKDGVNFVELTKLEGDGFTFADEFRTELVKNLGKAVDPVSFLTPQNKFEDKELMYLDLQGEGAEDIIQHWIGVLRPEAGMKYDDINVFKTLASIAFNSTSETNLKVLSQYQQHIVPVILDILSGSNDKLVRLRLPAQYFSSVILQKFVANGFVPQESYTWRNVKSVVDAAVLCYSGENIGMEVTRSRETLRNLIDVLTNMGAKVKEERVGKIDSAMKSMMEKLPEALQQMHVSKEEIVRLTEPLAKSLGL